MLAKSLVTNSVSVSRFLYIYRDHVCLYDVLLTSARVSGWFWAGSDVRLGSRDGAVTGDWSKTGGAGEPQPDNREFKVRMSASDMIVSALHFAHLRLKENMTRPVLRCLTTSMATER